MSNKFNNLMAEIIPEQTPQPTKNKTPHPKLRLVGISLLAIVLVTLSATTYLFFVAPTVKIRVPIQSPLYFENEIAPVVTPPTNHPKGQSR